MIAQNTRKNRSTQEQLFSCLNIANTEMYRKKLTTQINIKHLYRRKLHRKETYGLQKLFEKGEKSQ